jgi:hypothetical protein
MSWVSLLFSVLIMHICENDEKAKDITLDKFKIANIIHCRIFYRKQQQWDSFGFEGAF